MGWGEGVNDLASYIHVCFKITPSVFEREHMRSFILTRHRALDVLAVSYDKPCIKKMANGVFAKMAPPTNDKWVSEVHFQVFFAKRLCLF